MGPQAPTQFFSNNNNNKKRRKLDPKKERKSILQKDLQMMMMVSLKKPVPLSETTEEEMTKSKLKEKKTLKKKSYKDRNAKPVREGKRQFDKQSGTGRGKEISKNGAGGKGTWGTNPKSVAREEYNYDEDVFNSALNPKKEEAVKEVQQVQEAQQENKRKKKELLTEVNKEDL